jgi:hypothetical protein
MNSKMIIAGGMLLALMVMAGQPEKVNADTRVHVGIDLGGLFVPVDYHPRHGRYYPPPVYYERDRWYRVPPPPPPRGWYRRQAPPVYYDEYRRPHHRPYYRSHHWRRDRW